MSSSVKYIIGAQPQVQWALLAWQSIEPDTVCHMIELGQDAAYKFDLSELDGLSRESGTAFVVQDAQFLNFRRYELMAELKSRGFSMPPLIEKGAIVPTSAKVSENTWIGAGAILGEACSIGFNTVVGAGANIGAGAKIGNSVWIEAGVLIGSQAKIGSHTTLGQGLIVAQGIEVGKQSILDKPGKISSNVNGRTFVHASFDEPVVIVEAPHA